MCEYVNFMVCKLFSLAPWENSGNNYRYIDIIIIITIITNNGLPTVFIWNVSLSLYLF